MIQLRLRVSNKHGQKGSPLAVTSDMLEVIPSLNDVSLVLTDSLFFCLPPVSFGHLCLLLLLPVTLS